MSLRQFVSLFFPRDGQQNYLEEVDIFQTLGNSLHLNRCSVKSQSGGCQNLQIFNSSRSLDFV